MSGGLPDFSEYERKGRCVIEGCGHSALPTVAGDHMKCIACGHIFNEDGSTLQFQCWCKVCNPMPEGGMASLEEMSTKAAKERRKKEGNDNGREEASNGEHS